MSFPDLTQDRLKQLLRYFPDTGEFVWAVDRRRVKAGDRAGSPMSRGYIAIKVDSVLYQAHRLAWLYMTGAWPADQIDHINRARQDNRWSNLREVDNQANCNNKGNNTPNGAVYKDKKGFRVVKWVDGRQKHIGSFATEAEARASI